MDINENILAHVTLKMDYHGIYKIIYLEKIDLLSVWTQRIWQIRLIFE